jgi:hypothetical protein
MADLSKTTRLDSLSIGDAASILRDIGQSLRRVKGKPDLDAKGLRAVWHQGKLRTDLMSWETEAQDIQRQELAFFGRVVEFRKGQGLRTGTLPGTVGPDADESEGTGKSELFVPHRALDFSTLDAASTILKGCSKRDYFTQHLLTEITSAMSSQKPSLARTQMLGLELYQDLEKVMSEEQPESGKPRTTFIVVGIVGVCLVIAAVLFWFLWRRG